MIGPTPSRRPRGRQPKLCWGCRV